MKTMHRIASTLAVVAIVALGTRDAEASLLRQLDRVVALSKSGRAQDVEFTKRQVALTMRLGGTDFRIAYGVHGEQERKQVRYANLRAQLAGDRQAIFQRHGWPTYRTLEDYAGSRTERWTYAGTGVTYVFAGDQLVRTEKF